MRYMSIGIISFTLLLAWTGTAWPQPKARPTQQPLPEPTKKIIYKKFGDKELLLHVFEPPGHKATDKRPAIVLFHGGGWSIGDPTKCYAQCAYLAQRGMWAASGQYRLKPEDAKKIGDCVDDAKAAVRYMREHAKELGIDPERIAAGGGSAGGHIAAGAALLPETDAKGKAVSAKPDPLGKPNLLVLFNPALGGNYLDFKYFTKETPPSILFYGTKDWMVKLGPECVAQAKKVGFSVEVYTAEGQPHGFFRLQPWFDRTMYQADRFLAKNGYLKGDPTIKLPDGTHLQELK
jgi:acetyl esterase/lipase